MMQGAGDEVVMQRSPSQANMRFYSSVPMLGDSIDRNRYLAKISQVSNKQLELFKRAQEAKQVEIDPKERLIQKYMQGLV